jgi:hypothetical protein
MEAAPFFFEFYFVLFRLGFIPYRPFSTTHAQQALKRAVKQARMNSIENAM